MDFKAYLKDKQQSIDQALKDFFPQPQGPAATVIRAMQYSLFAGGKRLRPILCLAGAEAVGGQSRALLPVACGLELIHTYSLIHDDLPAMDNDDLRRGQPTNHKVFGEAMALLAGDGLLTEAFRLMTEMKLPESIPAQALLRTIGLIATAAGYQGMVGGQTVDIEYTGKKVNPSLLQFLHTRKTGALITAAVAAGAILGGGSEAQIRTLTAYGESVGWAFQIADDILDVEGDSKLMGKGTGGDVRKQKITYPAVVGLEQSKKLKKELSAQAITALGPFGAGAEPLRHLANYIIERKK
jgi:geranylgeranyl diphosphate synthase type II